LKRTPGLLVPSRKNISGNPRSIGDLGGFEESTKKEKVEEHIKEKSPYERFETGTQGNGLGGKEVQETILKTVLKPGIRRTRERLPVSKKARFNGPKGGSGKIPPRLKQMWGTDGSSCGLAPGRTTAEGRQ